MKKLFAIALLASFTTLAAPLQWVCDWPEAKSQTFSLYQGETATFEPTFRVNGRTVTNATIEAVWYQTNGMGNAWWKLDGATFAPSNDVGAAAYRFFVEAKTSDDILYRANGALRMLPSPGFTPNTIELPVARLDFAAVEVANAPWTDPDYSTNNTELVETIEATAPAPGNYAAVSNAAMTALQSYTETDPVWDREKGDYATIQALENGDIIVSQASFASDASFATDASFAENANSAGYANNAGHAGYAETADAAEPGGELDTQLTSLSSRVSLASSSATNALEIARAATATNAQQAAAIAEKQDKLPYPTNAIPYAAISGKPNLATVATSGSYNDLSNKPTIPTVPTNVSAFNNDAGYLTGYTESDPTISSWAKASSKPSYTASEVGAVPTSRTVNGKALSANISLTASDVGAATTSALNTLSSQVTAISGHLNAEDARFVSTNYNSQVHLPEAYVEVSVSNEWLTVWREMTRWDAFVGSAFDWTSWGGFLSWMSTTEAALDQKADRAWGYYDSHTGGWAPEGYTQVSSSNILIAAGMGYQRTVSSGHTYWVLTANEPYEVSGISSNGFFRVADADGNVQIEIIKGDKRTVPAPPDGVSASGGVLTVSYPVASQPTVEVSLTLADGGTWHAEDSASCPATVAWSGASGAYVATVTPSAPTAQLFVKASYQVGGETFINNRAPISITGGIYFNGTLYMPTVSGNELKFIAQ